MKKQIKKFSVHQTSKVIGFFYFVVTALVLFPLGFIEIFTDIVIGPGSQKHVFEFFLIPFIYWGMIYLLCLGATWIYNRIAASFGGITFELED